MPYRVDLRHVGADLLDQLVELGALDVEVATDQRVAALMPDRVDPTRVTGLPGVRESTVSPAIGRDDGSVWVLSPRAVHVGRLRIVPAHLEAEPEAIRLLDTVTFGTGLHPTTALCLEALDTLVRRTMPHAVLDVGTGSGVLALAALRLGVPRAVGLDIDEEALRVAAENARINQLDSRLHLARGGPETSTEHWPLVMANVLAAPLIEMAPQLARCVGHQGHLLLSGVTVGVEPDVVAAYRHLGMRRIDVMSRAAWVAVVLQASW